MLPVGKNPVQHGFDLSFSHGGQEPLAGQGKGDGVVKPGPVGCNAETVGMSEGGKGAFMLHVPKHDPRGFRNMVGLPGDGEWPLFQVHQYLATGGDGAFLSDHPGAIPGGQQSLKCSGAAVVLIEFFYGAREGGTVMKFLQLTHSLSFAGKKIRQLLVTLSYYIVFTLVDNGNHC